MNIGQVLKGIAPTVATLLGGPLAGLAVEAVAAVFGMEDATKESVIAKLENTQLSSSDIVKLREAELQLKARAQEIGLDLEKLEQADRQGARILWTALIPNERFFLFLLAYFMIGGFFYAVYYVLAGKLPTDPNHLVLVGAVIGYASAKADQVVGFFFGSSSDSRKKTDQLADALKNATK
jgi:hypothetical protein